MPHKTTLDSDTSKPSTTAPGDGPADTTDPTERASSVRASPGEDAIASGTVNAVRLVPASAASVLTRDEADDRFETYSVVRADGVTVKVRRNMDTGTSEPIGEG